MTNLINLNVDSMSKDEAMARFYKEVLKRQSSLVFVIDKSLNQTSKKHKTRFLQVSSPVQGVCYSLKGIGGKWRPGNKVTKISCSFEESAQVSEMFDDSTVLYCKRRPLMETSLSAWIPTPPKTVSSTLLVLGLYKIYALYFPKVKLANEFC